MLAALEIKGKRSLLYVLNDLPSYITFGQSQEQIDQKIIESQKLRQAGNSGFYLKSKLYVLIYLGIPLS